MRLAVNHTAGEWGEANVRFAVYTAIFGGYDALKLPIAQDIPCDFICFTDADWPKSVGPWRIVKVKPDILIHPRMQAKRYKLLSHEVFPGGRLPLATAIRNNLVRFRPYRASLWVDGSIAIKGSHFVREAVSGLTEREIAFFRHPDRDCIFDEAAVSVTMEKYHGQNIYEQVEYYRRLGAAPHSGLYACGIIGRREPASDTMRVFNTAWWKENLDWTYQDQLSVGMALKSSGLTARPIPGNLWSNDYFDWIGHTSNR